MMIAICYTRRFALILMFCYYWNKSLSKTGQATVIYVRLNLDSAKDL